MNQRNVCIVGLAAVAAVLAGCAAQYRNPGSCVAEMRSRLDGTSQGELTITHRAVSFRGQRVVIEGRLEQGPVPVPAGDAPAQPRTAPAGTAAASAPAAPAAPGQPHPTTPVGALVARFAHPHKTVPAAAECTFGESGLTSFRWLAPAELADTTPAPGH